MSAKAVSHRHLLAYVLAVVLVVAGALYGIWRLIDARTEQTVASIKHVITTELSDSTLTRTVTEEAIRITSENIADRTITGEDIAFGAVARDNLDPSVVDWVQGTQLLAPGTLLTPELVDALRQLLGLPAGVLDSLGLLDGLVSADQIAQGAVGVLQLAEDAVTSLSILDGSIELSDLNSTVIDALSFAGTLTDNSITSLHIADGAIELADLDSALEALLGTIGIISPGSIGPLHIADEAIGLDHLDGTVSGILGMVGIVGPGSITSLELAENAVTLDHLDGALTALIDQIGIIGDGAVALDNLHQDLQDWISAFGIIGTGAIDTDQLAAGAVTLLKLDDDSVDASKIVDGAITELDLHSDLQALLGTIGDIGTGVVEMTNLHSDLQTLLGGIGVIADGTVVLDDLHADLQSWISAFGVIGDGEIELANLHDDLAAWIAGLSVIGPGEITGEMIDGAAITLAHLDEDVTTKLDLLDILDSIVSGGNILILGNMIGDGAVTSSKLSAAANTRTVNTPLNISLSILGAGATDFPLFVAPTSGTITRITLTGSTAVNLSSAATVRKNNSGTVATTNLNIIDAGFTPYELTVTGNDSFVAGDVYSLHITGVASLGVTGLVTIEYVPSE